MIRNPEGDFGLFAARDHEFADYGDGLEGCCATGFSLSKGDYDALFHSALGCPSLEVYNDGEDVHQYHERQRLRFQSKIIEYPQLARLWLIGQVIRYLSWEVELLQRECYTVKEKTKNPNALRWLDIMIGACGEAMKDGKGLVVNGW